MFICEKCLTENYDNRPNFLTSRSKGPCQCCDYESICYDIHHSQLKPKNKIFDSETGELIK
jgi:hypothetical protein